MIQVTVHWYRKKSTQPKKKGPQPDKRRKRGRRGGRITAKYGGFKKKHPAFYSAESGSSTGHAKKTLTITQGGPPPRGCRNFGN